MLITLAVIALFLGFAIWLARYLLAHDAGEHEPRTALWVAFWFGVLGIALAGCLEFLIVPDILRTHALFTLGQQTLVVALIEEACKFALLALYLYKKPYFNEYTDGVIYFAIAGIGFGLPENILYTLQFGASAGLLRVIFTPMFHAAVTAIIGYALVRHKLGRTPRSLVWIGFLAAIGLHWVYDFGLFSGVAGLTIFSLCLSVALSLSLFWLISHAKARDLALRAQPAADNQEEVAPQQG